VRAGAAQYRNPWDFMRMGKLLEDLDSLAGSVAFRHWYGAAPATSPARAVPGDHPSQHESVAQSVCHAL